MTRDTRRATETRYERLRAAARARAEELTADSFGTTPVHLTGIGRTAMEAFRDQWANHPLKGSVAVIVSGAAVAYATALNQQQVRLEDPLPEVVPLYERIGFTLATPANQSPYCVWELP